MEATISLGTVLLILSCGLAGCYDQIDFMVDVDTNSGMDTASGTETNTISDTQLSECTSAKDCQLVNDCCNCMAIRTDQSPPDCPLEECDALSCNVFPLGVEGNITCVAGRCCLSLNCDDRAVTCEMARPECSQGETPVVAKAGNCWTGDCLKVTQCSAVPSCDVCGQEQPCVKYQEQEALTYHCVTNTEDCQDDVTCSCLAVSICTPPFYTCLESVNGLSCSCPGC